MNRVKCEKEMGVWTVRVNGVFIWESWWESRARRLAMLIVEALKRDS